MGKTRNLRDGVITIKDGAGTPNSLTVALDMGDLTFDEKRNYIQVLDRGVLDHVRAGDEEAVTLSFSAKINRFGVASGSPTIRDALTKQGGAAGWTSVGSTHEPYCSTIVFQINDPASGGTDHEVLTFAKFFVESIKYSEGDEYNTVEVSGFSFATKPTVA